MYCVCKFCAEGRGQKHGRFARDVLRFLADCSPRAAATQAKCCPKLPKTHVSPHVNPIFAKFVKFSFFSIFSRFFFKNRIYVRGNVPFEPFFDFWSFFGEAAQLYFSKTEGRPARNGHSGNLEELGTGSTLKKVSRRASPAMFLQPLGALGRPSGTSKEPPRRLGALADSPREPQRAPENPEKPQRALESARATREQNAAQNRTKRAFPPCVSRFLRNLLKIEKNQKRVFARRAVVAKTAILRGTSYDFSRAARRERRRREQKSQIAQNARIPPCFPSFFAKLAQQ